MKPRRFFSHITAIALTTFTEIRRERILYGMLLVSMLVTAASFFLATISLDQDSRILQNIGLSSIHLLTLLILVFVSCTSIAKDLERRTLYFLFAKPLSKTEYVLGKYLGFLIILAVTLFIMVGLFSFGLYFLHRELISVALISSFYSFLELSLLIAFAGLFAYFTSAINAMLYTFALFVIGHALATMLEYTQRFSPVAVQNMIKACYYLFPNLEKFDVRRILLYGLDLPLTHVVYTVLYWLLYVAFALWLSVLVMKKREL